MNERDSKVCSTCGRAFAYRSKWASSWEQVRHCSERCRRHKPGETDRALEQTILSLLRKQSRAATITPSDAARAQFGEQDWQAQLERTRQAARRLVATGELEMTQGGRVVTPEHARGEVSLRLKRR